MTETDAESTSQSKSATVYSVVVAMRIIELLAETGRALRVTDIAAQLEMTKARVSRHLTTLSDLGMVSKMPDNSGYKLGTALFQLANSASEHFEITNIASRHMLTLRNEISEALVLAIPDGGDALIVSTIASGKSDSPPLSRGSRSSVPDSPAAWVILAYSPNFVVERMFTQSELVVEQDEFDDHVAQVRDRLYDSCLDPRGDKQAEISVPIFGRNEKIEAVLTVVASVPSVSDQLLIRHLPRLQTAAAEISRALGSQEMADEIEARSRKTGR